MTKERKWIIAAMVIAYLLMLPISLILYRHMSLLPRMFGYSRIFGNSALHWAAEDGRTRTVEKLLAKGADIECRNKNGYTPLHSASSRGHKKTVELLIAKGADVNARDSIHSATPLHDAVGFGNVEVVKLLINAGADVNARMNNDRTPLDCASPSFLLDEKEPFRTFFKIFFGIDKDACAKLLIEHGARGVYSPKKRQISMTNLPLGVLVFFFGLGVCLVGCTWFFVVAFKEDILWGVASLMFPPVALVFLASYWDKCRKPFFVHVTGVLICFIGMLLQPVFL